MYGANALLPAISIHALHEENDGDAVEDRADLRISIHALHEESDVLHRVHRHLQPISIHALHEESDISGCNVSGEMPAISIHALHEESDLPHTTSRPLMRYFNPRSP